MSKRKERIFLKGFSDVAAFFLLLALLLPAVQAQAYGYKHWVGESGSWDVPWNWSPSGQPAYGAVDLVQGDAVDRTVWYWNTASPSAVLSTLRINASGTGTITLSQDRDPLRSGYETIGESGTGTFTQSGGTNTVTNGLTLGTNSTGSGTYDLSGGSLSARYETIGESGTGRFTQSGGTNTVTIELYLGYNSAYYSTGSGTYDLFGGSLSADHEHIGLSGTGSFTQSGGTHTVTSHLYLGTNATGIGAYALSGTGSLSAASETIGDYGTGAFTQSGGTNTVTNLALGYYSGSGTYDLSGTGSLSAGTEFIGLNGTGSFTQSGGTNTVGDFYLGYTTTTSGTYDLSGGILSAPYEDIGTYGTGSFTQTGGTNTVTNTLFIAEYSGASGTYDLQGGTLSVGTIINKGTFNWTGGTLNYNSPLTIGTAGRLGAALVLDSDMALNTPAETIAADGTLTQTGGSHTVSGELRVRGAYHMVAGGDVTASDWTIDPAGTVTGGVGGLFKAGHSFSNHSFQNASWDTDLAELVLSGSSMTMDLAGADYGASDSGYTDNFAWGIFHIGSALTDLTISDGVPSNSGAALYVGLFEIDGGLTDLTNISSNYNIYYDADLPGNGWLNGQSYALHGSGFLMPVSSVPEPTSMLLIGTGLIGLIGRGRTKRNAA